MTHHTLHLGDCLEVMRTMPDCSVDAVVTDPPYGLSFMGKAWDYDVPGVDVWREVLRVLKPGGHLLAFAGTRTQHRMAVAIEDAGFEIRDMIAWVYGSGFPKSLNVATAIVKLAEPKAEPKAEEVEFCQWLRDNSTLEAVSQALGRRFWDCKVEIVNAATKESPVMARRALVPTAAKWQRFKAQHLGAIPPRIEELAKPEPQRAETPGEEWTPGKGNGTTGEGDWQGWGTALKPALEPITMARKPLTGTVAANVLEHGTGALNVDGCRVGTEDMSAQFDREWKQDGTFGNGKRASQGKQCPPGRWPANLIHDGSDEVVGLFPADRPAGNVPDKGKGSPFGGVNNEARPGGGYSLGDSGSAARFFKQCKGYAEAWPNVTPEPASTAGNCSSQQRQFVASALSDAATWALQGASCSNVSLAPSTSATGSELRQLCESVITAIQSIGPRFWHESEPARLTLKLSHASFAVHREPTGITTITASHWTSGGSADPVTFNIIGSSTAAGDQASVPRAFYTAKATRAERQGVTHPTVKPLDLMAYLCRLVTPPGGTVLDPFMGSGTTIKAAISEGFNAIGIEREPAYFAMAEHRMNGAQLGLPLTTTR